MLCIIYRYIKIDSIKNIIIYNMYLIESYFFVLFLLMIAPLDSADKFQCL